jgi:hypothetical protein
MFLVEKNKRYMHSHPQPAPFNMDAWSVCGEKRIFHKQSDAENRCRSKTELASQAVLCGIKPSVLT